MGSLLDTINGLPIHALVVHAVVVLVPLAALGAILVVVIRSFSRRYASLVVVISGIAFVSSLLAKESGEQLAKHLGTPTDHAAVGQVMPIVALVLFVLVTVFWLVDRGIPMNRHRPLWLTLLGLAVVVAALWSIWWTFRVGHSGAEAVWNPLMSKS